MAETSAPERAHVKVTPHSAIGSARDAVGTRVASRPTTNRHHQPPLHFGAAPMYPYHDTRGQSRLPLSTLSPRSSPGTDIRQLDRPGRVSRFWELDQSTLCQRAFRVGRRRPANTTLMGCRENQDRASMQQYHLWPYKSSRVDRCLLPQASSVNTGVPLQ